MSEYSGPPARASHEQPSEDQERLLPLDLSRLSPHEIVALQRYARNSETGLVTDVDEAFDDFIPSQPEFAGKVLTAFADSPLAEDRYEVAEYFVDDLTTIDRETGLALWNRLIRDTAPGVRYAAYYQLTFHLGETTQARSEDELRRLGANDELAFKQRTGLTLEDARSLLEAYAAAEEGENLYDPGLEALKKLRGEA